MPSPTTHSFTKFNFYTDIPQSYGLLAMISQRTILGARLVQAVRTPSNRFFLLLADSVL